MTAATAHDLNEHDTMNTKNEPIESDEDESEETEDIYIPSHFGENTNEDSFGVDEVVDM